MVEPIPHCFREGMPLDTSIDAILHGLACTDSATLRALCIDMAAEVVSWEGGGGAAASILLLQLRSHLHHPNPYNRCAQLSSAHNGGQHHRVHNVSCHGFSFLCCCCCYFVVMIAMPSLRDEPSHCRSLAPWGLRFFWHSIAPCAGPEPPCAGLNPLVLALSPLVLA